MSAQQRTATFIFGNRHSESEKKTVKRFFAGSFVLHVLFILVFASGLILDRGRRIEFSSVQARLVKLGVERDKKLLPRITKKEKAKAPIDEKGNALTADEKKKDKKDDKKDDKKAPSLAELLSGSIKDIKEDARAEETDEGAADGVEDGDVTDPALALKADMYTRKISALIRNNWSIPGIIQNDQLKGLQAEAFFRITYSGEVYSVEIRTSSGNNLFDSSVIEAIKKTGTLPLPEDRDLKKLVLKEGFECPFTPG
ncbi:MAG TPA: cell envelope integrity protein TolA [bacterium]|nr:cell envelope integrity protein TolA [bacterium]HPS28685.1 cell envelope integrity protein TolA [bacterium]